MVDLNSIISNNIVEKDDMKVSLSASDGAVNQYLFFDNGLIKVRVSEINIVVNNINDSFILNSTTNALISTTKLGDRRTVNTSLSTSLTVDI